MQTFTSPTQTTKECTYIVCANLFPDLATTFSQIEKQTNKQSLFKYFISTK